MEGGHNRKEEIMWKMVLSITMAIAFSIAVAAPSTSLADDDSDSDSDDEFTVDVVPILSTFSLIDNYWLNRAHGIPVDEVDPEMLDPRHPLRDVRRRVARASI